MRQRFLFGFDFVFVADGDVSGPLWREIPLNFTFPLSAGFGGFGPGLEESDGPEVFVEADLFLFSHSLGGKGTH